MQDATFNYKNQKKKNGFVFIFISLKHMQILGSFTSITYFQRKYLWMEVNSIRSRLKNLITNEIIYLTVKCYFIIK
jgi:hypothetical protein